MLVASVLVLLAVLAVFVHGDFQVRVKNINNNAYTMSCAFLYNENFYEPGQKTTTLPEYWVNRGDGSFDLKFHWIDNNHSNGGRCQTSTSSALVGNGVFTTEIYIHSNAAASDGVFTVAIINSDFSQNTELDLVVVNLSENVVKSGKPFHAVSIGLDQVSQRWLSVRMVKNGDYCTTTFTSIDDNRVLNNPQAAPCTLAGDGNNFVVVNSRARSSISYADGTVTVRSVSWDQN
eukprot:gene25104-30321_t